MRSVINVLKAMGDGVGNVASMTGRHAQALGSIPSTAQNCLPDMLSTWDLGDQGKRIRTSSSSSATEKFHDQYRIQKTTPNEIKRLKVSCGTIFLCTVKICCSHC